MEKTEMSVESAEISVEGIEELETSINSLVEFLETEKAEKQQSEEEEIKHFEILQSDLENEEEFREAVLTALNEITTDSKSYYTDFQEFKTQQIELNAYINEALPAVYWGSISLIVLVVMIPLYFVSKVLANLFNRFL